MGNQKLISLLFHSLERIHLSVLHIYRVELLHGSCMSADFTHGLTVISAVGKKVSRQVCQVGVFMPTFSNLAYFELVGNKNLLLAL